MGLCRNKGRCCLRDSHPRASGRCFCCVLLQAAKRFFHILRQTSRVCLKRREKSRFQSEKFHPTVMTLVWDTSNMSKSSNSANINAVPCAISRSRSDTCYCIPSTVMVNDRMPRRGSDWTETVRRDRTDVQNILKPLNQPNEKTCLIDRRYSGLYSGLVAGLYTKATPVASQSSTSTKPAKEVSRSQSMKAKKSNESRYRNRGSSIPSETCTGTKVKQRTVSNRSLPLPGDEADYLRLRNFSVTSKGVINRGDSFRSKTPSVPPQDEAERAVEKTETPSANKPGIEAYRVLLVGATDVGKTALMNQFRTSEYISAYENVHDDEQDKAVTVVLNSEESEIEFEESPLQDGNAWFQDGRPDPDAYVLVYSVSERRSYLQARHFLSKIESQFDSRAVILVGNKTDLARLRCVTTEEGKSLAKERGCKFIETSAAINHQVDELLVGILTQIRMKKAKIADKHKKKRESTRRTSNCPGSKASGVLKKILRRACLKSKSCDNLHVL